MNLKGVFYKQALVIRLFLNELCGAREVIEILTTVKAVNA